MKGIDYCISQMNVISQPMVMDMVSNLSCIYRVSSTTYGKVSALNYVTQGKCCYEKLF